MPPDQFESATQKIRVWDRFVRVGHWLLAVTFLIAYLMEDDLLLLHVWAGYLAISTVLLWIVWGLMGPPHARFRDSMYSPAESWRYLVDLLRGRSRRDPGRRHLDHGPAGAIMVYALLISVAATTVSGVFVYALEERAGIVALPSARSEAGEPTRESAAGEFWGGAHEFSANVMLALVVLHIGGVLLASLAHRENPVRAMITDTKRSLEEAREK